MSNGYQCVGATFMPIGREGKMSDIEVAGYTGEYPYDDSVIAAKLDTYGRNGTGMYWMDFEEYEDWGEIIPAHHGWYDLDGEENFGDVPLAPGEGLWVKCPADLYLQSAGQVISEYLPVVITNGYRLVANATPMTLKLGQVWIGGYTGEYPYDDSVIVAKLDTYGRNGTGMYWMDFEEYEDWGEIIPAHHGWYDLDGEECFNNTVTLTPGEALWVNNPVDDDLLMCFPSPLQKDDE